MNFEHKLITYKVICKEGEHAADLLIRRMYEELLELRNSKLLTSHRWEDVAALKVTQDLEVFVIELEKLTPSFILKDIVNSTSRVITDIRVRASDETFKTSVFQLSKHLVTRYMKSSGLIHSLDFLLVGPKEWSLKHLAEYIDLGYPIS